MKLTSTDREYGQLLTAKQINDACLARWHELDPALPNNNIAPSTGEEAQCVRDGSGVSVAVVSSHIVHPPRESLKATWGPLEQLRLTARIAGKTPALELDLAITALRKDLKEIPHSVDSCATLSWPSRDVVVVPTLLSHGFNAYNYLAIRQGQRFVVPAVRNAEPCAVRRATIEDAQIIARLWLELVSYDSNFGAVFLRQNTAEMLLEDTIRALREPTNWVWVAELDGSVIGFVRLSPPDEVAWLHSYTLPHKLAYLNAAYVTPKARGISVGMRLISHAHQFMDTCGIEAILLHYSPINPLASSFWSRMGYRQLWTTWRAQPAHTIR